MTSNYDTSTVQGADSLVARMDVLSKTKFAPRAAEYDRNIAYPSDDFKDLHEQGFMNATVPESWGGLGIGMSNGDPLTMWQLTTAVARGDLSLGRCYEGHINSIDLLNALGTQEQKQRFFPDVVKDHASFVFWGSDAARQAAGGGDPEARFVGGTVASPVAGGWRLNGRKQFSTSAGGATYSIVFAEVPGTSSDPIGRQHLLIMDTAAPGVSIDPSWWHVLGMRATVSHMVNLEDVFVPKENLLCTLPEYLQGLWQAKFIPQFAASFLGAAEAAYEFAAGYVKDRGRENDPYVLHHVASMSISLDLLRTYLHHTARLWMAGRDAEAAVTSNICRAVGEEQAMNVVSHAIRCCGASGLLEKFPLERIMRDLQTYVRHENTDALIATVGRAALGLHYDANFSNPRGVDSATKLD